MKQKTEKKKIEVKTAKKQEKKIEKENKVEKKQLAATKNTQTDKKHEKK